MSDKTEEQEDILAVTEELSSDLAATQTEESVEEAEEEDSTAEEGEDGAEGDVVESDAGDEDATDQGDGSESTEADDAEAESTDKVAEGSFDAAFDDQYLTEPATDANVDPRTREEKRPQAQEREGRVYHDTMKDPTRPSPINNPDPFADHTRESEEEGDGAAEAEASEEETGLEEKFVDLERRVQEAEDQKTALLEENARLKKALHRTLVERVVDQKIALGLVTGEDRGEQLEEHATRTAASLADSLRDLSGMTATIQRPDPSKVETIEQKLMAVDDDGSKITGESDASTETKDPVSQMEDVLVDALMGRRKL